MLWVDYAIIGIIAVSAVVGLARGLLREVLSFVIWLGAVFLAWVFHKELAGLLVAWIASPTIRLGLAFLLVVVAVLILGAILGYLLSLLVDKSGLTGTDRVLGLVFGAARGAILVAMVVFLVALTPVVEEHWWQESELVDRFQVLADRVLDWIPSDLVDWLKTL